MELRTLQYFVTVVKEGNITKAAQALHMTQPALSIQIKDLEEELGTPLLNRGNRHITLTTEGNFFYQKAREILGLVNFTRETLEGFSEINGTLYLGGTDSQYNEELFKTFHQLRQEYPQINLNFLSGTIEDTFKRLDSGDIDFAIILGPVDTEKYNTLPLPWWDIFSALVPDSSPLYLKEVLKHEDFETQQLILPNHPMIRKIVAGWLNMPLEMLNVSSVYTFPYTASSLVQAGLGIALCKDAILNTSQSNLRFIPIEDPISLPLQLLWRRDSAMSQVALKFLDVVTEKVATAEYYPQ